MSATFWSAKKLDSRLNVEDDTFWWPGLFSNVEAAVAVILLFAVALTLGASVPRRAGAMMVARVVIMICVFIFARFGYNSFNVTHLSSTHTKARRLLPSLLLQRPIIAKALFFFSLQRFVFVKTGPLCPHQKGGGGGGHTLYTPLFVNKDSDFSKKNTQKRKEKKATKGRKRQRSHRIFFG